MNRRRRRRLFLLLTVLTVISCYYWWDVRRQVWTAPPVDALAAAGGSRDAQNDGKGVHLEAKQAQQEIVNQVIASLDAKSSARDERSRGHMKRATPPTAMPSSSTGSFHDAPFMVDECPNGLPQGAGSGHHVLRQPPPGGCRKFVAVVAPVTSRKTDFRNVNSTPFAWSCFPSAVASLVHFTDAGYDVAFYVGYDAEDTVWNTNMARRSIVQILQAHVDSVFATHRNATEIGMSLRTVRCQSTSMVAATNCIVSQVYNDGAEYWYRVNDDTVFQTGDWIRGFNTALATFEPREKPLTTQSLIPPKT